MLLGILASILLLQKQCENNTDLELPDISKIVSIGIIFKHLSNLNNLKSTSKVFFHQGPIY